jgi:uncharacterized protein
MTKHEASVAIAIFVKTPTLSPIKTRLAQTCGRQFAERFSMLSARAVMQVSLLTKQPVYWAVAETDEFADRFWSDQPRIHQGQGGLGARMWTVMQQLIQRHGAGLLLGADTPQIEPERLQPAIDWLAHPEARQCLGPARDGGFWCYGQNRATDQSLWNIAQYSTAKTAVEFQAAMRDQGEMQLLSELTDVDQLADLASCRASLSSLHTETSAQKLLRRWLSCTGKAVASQADQAPEQAVELI